MIVAGKGGVGKTTMVAALAHLAAGAGLSVLVIELEGRPGSAPRSAAPAPSATPVRSSMPPAPPTSATAGPTRGGR